MQPNDGKDEKVTDSKNQENNDLLKEINDQAEAASYIPEPTKPEPVANPSVVGKPAVNSLQNQTLLDIKHKALAQLSDLVDNLEHSPEQHFQTLMMIIQETDNIGMIDKAYTTALQLKDAKERAQALLSVANEINYFTAK